MSFVLAQVSAPVLYVPARGTTVDATPIVQSAIALARTLGRSRIMLGEGTHYFPNNGTSIDPGTGDLEFIGESHAAILQFDEGTGAATSDLSSHSLFKNTDNITKGYLYFRGLHVKGTRATSLVRRGGTPFWCDYYDRIILENCFIEEVTNLAMDFHYCKKALFYSNYLRRIGADGLRARDCAQIIALGNHIQGTGDDAMAFHTNTATLESFTPIREGILISNNHLFNAGTIKCLGGRSVVVSGNKCHLSNINAIELSIGPSEVTEGDNPIYDLSITGNIVTDLLTVSPSIAAGNAAIVVSLAIPRGATATHSIIPYRWDSTDSVTIKPWNWYFKSAAPAATANAVPPGSGIHIAGNIYRRTLPVAANFSAYGYGNRIWQGAEYDPQVTDTHLRPNAFLQFNTAARSINVAVEDNTFEHVTNGITLPAPTTDYDYRNWVISRNRSFDVLTRGILVNSGAFRVGLVIADNDLVGDWHRANANSNADGTYAANSTPIAIDTGNCTGIVIRANRMSYWCRTIASNVSASCVIEDNVGFCGIPVAIGFNTGNKGIGEIFTGFGTRYVLIDADPTSATHEALSSVMVKTASAMPTSGWYYRGWFVSNTLPALAGGKVTIGWTRLTTGTAHVADTDWAAAVVPNA